MYVNDGFSFDNEPDKQFKLHQSYQEPGDTKQIKCAKCGQTRLEVGHGDYFTVVRCPDCGHECCVHNG